jgi:Ras-related protein Rab-6A
MIYVLANKIDLEESRQVTKDLSEAKAKELGAQFQEVSAKTGVNIPEFFQKLSYDLMGN